VFSGAFHGKIASLFLLVMSFLFMDPRQKALEHWLHSDCQLRDATFTPMAGDASFRRYFRVALGNDSYVAMDAPLDHENCRPFIAIARALRARNLCAPEIIASTLSEGFLLLSDLGQRVYLGELNAGNAESLYDNALDALAVLQSCHTVTDWRLPQFSAEFMYQELQNFKEWFLTRHLSLIYTASTEKMLADFFLFLAGSATSQPQVFMHRDYHSANLMVLPDKQVGILDFQDAFIGPVTYDLVSLLRDCYIAWPETFVKKLALQYKEKISSVVPVSDEIFLRWFDLMGLQRHLKALLTFARKYHRDANADYLQHVPRTLNYIADVSSRYAESAAFNHYLNAEILPALEKVTVCAQ
jgi:aminoglycoside/choline kinase family phosphotransferase